MRQRSPLRPPNRSFGGERRVGEIGQRQVVDHHVVDFVEQILSIGYDEIELARVRPRSSYMNDARPIAGRCTNPARNQFVATPCRQHEIGPRRLERIRSGAIERRQRRSGKRVQQQFPTLEHELLRRCGHVHRARDQLQLRVVARLRSSENPHQGHTRPRIRHPRSRVAKLPAIERAPAPTRDYG